MIIGTTVVIVTVVFHVACLVVLATRLRRWSLESSIFQGVTGHIAMLVFTVLVIIGIHTIEAWVWAVLYVRLGEFSILQDALYFSVVTSTTLGYGDITLSEQWQLLGTFEAMGGLILFGVSTAFLFATIARLFDDDQRS